jgi:peptide/nickel transport system permease protein
MITIPYLKKKTVLAALLILHLPVLFAGFFSPNDYAAQNRELPFAPPTRIHFIDESHNFHVRPFVYAWKEDSNGSGEGTYSEDHARIFPIRFFVSDSNDSGGELTKNHWHFFGVEKPGSLFLFGTDDFGRDEFSRMLYGGRISLFAGAVATTIALSLGVVFGIVSGYYGKWVDALVMRGVDLFLALPWLYLLFAVRAVLPLQIKTTQTFLLLIGVIGIVGWARPARLLRGLVLSAKERNFVLASRAFGASDFHILRRHILPQTYGTLLTLAALLLPQFILAELTLSFLGLGVGEPMPSWGNLLAELQKYNVLTSYWWMYLPALSLVALFLAYYWVSKTLEDRVARVRL